MARLVCPLSCYLFNSIALLKRQWLSRKDCECHCKSHPSILKCRSDQFIRVIIAEYIYIYIYIILTRLIETITKLRDLVSVYIDCTNAMNPIYGYILEINTLALQLHVCRKLHWGWHLYIIVSISPCVYLFTWIVFLSLCVMSFIYCRIMTTRHIQQCALKLSSIQLLAHQIKKYEIMFRYTKELRCTDGMESCKMHPIFIYLLRKVNTKAFFDAWQGVSQSINLFTVTCLPRY